MIHLREQYWSIKIPIGVEGGAEIRGAHSGRTYQILSFYGEADAFCLPENASWEIVCMIDKATYAEASGIVEHNGLSFMDYSKDYPAYGLSPFESADSLLTSKGCDTKLNWLILKKVA
jgi:hypothetical protein